MDINLIVISFIAFFSGLAIGLVCYIFIKQKFLSEIEKSHFILQKVNVELENINEKNKILYGTISNFEQNTENLNSSKKNLEFENQKLREDFIKQESTINHAYENLKNLMDRLSQIENKKNELESINQDINCRLASIEAQKKTLEVGMKLMNDSLLHQFKNIAMNVMNENSEKFTEESKKRDR